MSPISFAELATWSLCADSIASIQKEPKRTREKEQMLTANAFPLSFDPPETIFKKKHKNMPI